MDVLVVAMNYPPERSGTAPYTGAWARHAAGEHRVTVLAGPPHYPEWRIHEGYGGWTDERTENGIAVRRVRHVVPARPSAVSRVAHETSFAARALAHRGPRPDLVVAVSPPLFGAAAAARLARRHGVPFGLIVQDIYSEGVRELDAGGRATGRAERAITAVEKRTLAAADRVLTIHERFRSLLVERLGVVAERVDVVPNWTHVPPATVDRETERARLGWTGRFVALHAGNMGAKQGLENVVDAAALGGDDLHVVLLGDGNQRALLEARAAGGLEFLPPADRAGYPNVLAAADVLLVNERPGVAEMSLPSKLTSYFAAGRPVVAAVDERGATAQVIRDSGGGTIVPPGRPELLRAAVAELRGDPDRAARIAARGRAWADAHCSPDAAMAGYDRWLHALAGLPSPEEARP